jgi:tetratricopeptide (TPR) repeat protein
VEPLPVTVTRRGSDAVLAHESDAVRLFVDRAKSFVPAFQLTEDNASTVAGICGRVEGLPLSIELAAAKLQILTVTDLLVQLQNRLTVLKRSDRSLQSALEWSYDLLDSSAQALLQRLSVFAGGAGSQAVLGVCSMGATAEVETQDALETLIRSSLVVFKPDANRYILLETIREYALQKLKEGPDASKLWQTHAKYYANMAEKVELGLRGGKQIDSLSRLNADHENFRAAFQWASKHAEAILALRLSSSLAYGFWMNGNSAEGLRWLETSLELASGAGLVAQRREWAKAMFYAGLLAWEHGDHELGVDRWTKSLSVAERFADPWLQAFTACWLGFHSGTKVRDPEAVIDLKKAIERFRSLGDPWGEGFGLLCLGETERALEKYDLAKDSYEKSLQCWIMTGEVWWQGAILHNLGYLRRRAGRHDEARRLFQDSLKLFARLKSHWSIAYSLTALVGSAVDKKQWSRAIRLAAAAKAMLKMAGVMIQPADEREYGADFALARKRINKGLFERSWKMGEAMSLDQVIVYALGKRNP